MLCGGLSGRRHKKIESWETVSENKLVPTSKGGRTKVCDYLD